MDYIFARTGDWINIFLA